MRRIDHPVIWAAFKAVDLGGCEAEVAKAAAEARAEIRAEREAAGRGE
jgi:hypothetical protein